MNQDNVTRHRSVSHRHEWMPREPLDPLEFVARHLPEADRRPDCVVILLYFGAQARPMVNIVELSGLGPSLSECRKLVRPFALVGQAFVSDQCLPGLGVVVHESAFANGISNNWQRAAAEVTSRNGLQFLGVATRLGEGDFVIANDEEAA